jgi:hypothetical protein
LLGKPVLDGEILSFNPPKLAQLLPERLNEYRHTRSSASIQETDAEDFPCLLRLGRPAKRKEQSANGKTSDFFSHECFPAFLRSCFSGRYFRSLYPIESGGQSPILERNLKLLI